MVESPNYMEVRIVSSLLNSFRQRTGWPIVGCWVGLENTVSHAEFWRGFHDIEKEGLPVIDTQGSPVLSLAPRIGRNGRDMLYYALRGNRRQETHRAYVKDMVLSFNDYYTVSIRVQETKLDDPRWVGLPKEYVRMTHLAGGPLTLGEIPF